MSSAIKEIYLDNRGFAEKTEPNENYWNAHKKYDEVFEKLLKGSTKEQRLLLNELFENVCKIEAETGETNFTEGFKLGLRIAVEVFK